MRSASPWFGERAGPIERKNMARYSHPATASHHDCREVHIAGRDAKTYSQRQNKCAHGSLLSPDSHPRWYVSNIQVFDHNHVVDTD